MADFNMTVTVSGLKLLTDALAGKMVTLTGIHLGSGSYTGNLSAATQLVQEQIALPLDKIIKGDSQITAKSVLQFRVVETGFIWTEVGLFAKESDGPEILYAYGYAGNKGDYIPGADEATLNEKVIRLTMLSSNEANIVAEVDGSTVYASQEDLDDLRESVELSITNITNVIQQVTGVDPSDPDAAPDGSMVVTLTHTKSDTVHTFTGLGERTGLIPCQFKSTAGYTEGDTATIDGTAYTITLTGADAPETDLFVSGKSILIDVDTEGKLINFKSGGGLTNGKLALADATEDTVFNGRTFYAGNSKEIRTGRAMATATNVTAAKMFTGVTAYNQQGQLITGNPTASTATAADILKGKKAYNNSGKLMNGTLLKSGTLISTVPQTLSNLSSNTSSYTLTFTPPNGTHLVVFDQVGEYITGWGEESALGGVIIDLGGTNKQISGAQITWSSLGSGGSIYTTFTISTISTSSIKVKIAVKPQNQYHEYDVAWLTVTGYFYA